MSMASELVKKNLKDMEDEEVLKKHYASKDSWAIVAEKHGLRQRGQKILIQEDPYKSRYDCSDCKGTGHTDEICTLCKGDKFEVVFDEQLNEDVRRPCRGCTVMVERNISYGKKLCPTCKGRQGVLIMTDDSKKRPTTGTVIAIGDKVTEWKVGDKVIFNNYTGTAFELENTPLRVMKEDDVLSEWKPLKNGQFEEVDLQADLKEAGIV